MSGGPVDMAPINAVLEKFGHEVGVLTEKVRALEGDDTSKMGAIDKQNKEISGLKVVIDKQKGEISGLKGEVNEQVQKISDQKGEISGLKKTMDEQAQKISELQKQLSASLKENKTLREETLQTAGSPEQKKADAGAAGSKRDGSAALEDRQPAKAQRTEAAADAAPMAGAAADAGGGAADDGSGTPSSDATEEMITPEMVTATDRPGASLAEAGLDTVSEMGDEIGDEIGEGAPGEGAPGEGAPGEGTPEAAASSEAGASGALLQLQEREDDRLLPPSAGVAPAVLQLVHYKTDAKEGDVSWIKEIVLALRQDGSLYAFASTGPGTDLSRQGAEAAEGPAASCGRCLLGPVDAPASVDPTEMRMQHGPKKMVIVARQGKLTYLSQVEHIFEHGCHGDAPLLALGEKELERLAADKSAKGARCKDLKAQKLFSRVIETVHKRGQVLDEEDEDLVNFFPTGFVFNESSQNLFAIASKNGTVVAKQAAAEGPSSNPNPSPSPNPHPNAYPNKQANISDEKFSHLEGVQPEGDGSSLLIFIDSGEKKIEKR